MMSLIWHHPFLVCWSWVIMVLWLSSGNIILSNFLFPIGFLIYGHIFASQCLTSMNSLMTSISLSIAGQLWVGGLHASLRFMLKLILQLLVFIICAFNCAYFTSCFHTTDITKGYCPAKLQLVFRPHKNSHQPALNAKLYAVVLWYSKIPPWPNCNTQMYEVYQEFNMKQECKSGIVELS